MSFEAAQRVLLEAATLAETSFPPLCSYPTSENGLYVYFLDAARKNVLLIISHLRLVFPDAQITTSPLPDTAESLDGFAGKGVATH